MHDQRINLIDQNLSPQAEVDQEKIKEIKKSKSKRWPFRFLIFFIALAIFFSTNIIFSQNSLITNLGRLSFWEGMARLVVGKDKILKGEILDRTNFLILGMGGAQHEGPYLTDTIILASLRPSTQELALLSIPRDLYVPIPDYGWQKINFANALGVARKKDGGELASKVVGNILDLPIHYWVRADFQIFKDVIDELGGIEIEVETSFVDHEFPGPNFTYRTISFNKGWQTMDGETALRFVRSRHGSNGENSDFARARRQQKVLFAIKEKIEQENILTQPQKIYSFYQALEGNLSSNLDLSQSIRLAKIISQIQLENIKTQVIEDGPNGLLKSEITLQGAFVLTPKSGDFKELAQMAKEMLDLPGEKLWSQTAIASEQKIKIIILNGTHVPGLASQTSQELEKIGITTLETGNAPQKDYSTTTIFQLNPSSSLNQIQKIQQALNQSLIYPKSELDQEIRDLFSLQSADFLIILGEN